MRHVTLITAVLAIAGCSDPKAATESNFKSAVQAYVSTLRPCISLPNPLPAEITERERDYERQLSVHDELVSIGFLSREPFEKEMPVRLSFLALAYSTRRPTEMVAGVRYSITDTGMAAKRESDSPEEPPSFCYGRYRVVEVTNFTEPAPVFGTTVSTVHYKWETTDIADWAVNSGILQNEYPDLLRDLESQEEPHTGTATVVLTGKGWVHDRQFGS